jgi:phosphate-selective porin OprO and OprP
MKVSRAALRDVGFRRVFFSAICAVLWLPAASPANAQGTAVAQSPEIDRTVEAAESDGDVPKRSTGTFNQYEAYGFSVRWGFGFLYDYSTYSQDDNSKAQMNLSPVDDVRDFRVLFKGKVPIPHVTYTLGYMYDKAKGEWRFRQTGFMVEMPRAHGNVFIGRTKEGFSTSKIMVGYQGWTNERAAANDALIPILADGIKWNGYIPSGKLVYNIGFFGDSWSQNESFNKHDNQVVGRAVWLPLAGADTGVLHMAFEVRHALANDGSLQYRSKPESFQAQSYAIDTGKFAADRADTYGVETYYRPGPLMFGGEYFFNKVTAPDSGNPFFHGGEVLAAYILTGETRPYNARGGYFDRISPKRPLFMGGRGAWELVTRFSYADFDNGPIRGGIFWRFTPMVNWHMSDNVRLEIVYGYGSLNRPDVTGRLHFFQSRIQFQL